jgi:hypothetical protein
MAIKRQTRAQLDTIAAARHEAGHVIGAWAAGVRVTRVCCTGQRATVGRIVGNTSLNAIDLLLDHPPSREASYIQVLAGDAANVAHFDAAFSGQPFDQVEYRRHGPSHLVDISDEVGKAAFDGLWSAAKALVAERQADIDAVTAAILASPDLALYDDRDLVLAEGNVAAAGWRYGVDQSFLDEALASLRNDAMTMEATA